MKFCKFCGNKLEQTDLYCQNCGAKVEASESAETAQTVPAVDLSAGQMGRNPAVAVVSFLIPLIGLIIWALNKDSNPGLSVSAAKGALASVCLGAPLVGLILWIVWKESQPEYAKTCGISAIVGAVLGVILFIAYFALMIILAMLSEGYYAAAFIGGLL